MIKDGLYSVMDSQASMHSYLDTFWLLGIATGITFLMPFLLRKPRIERGISFHLKCRS